VLSTFEIVMKIGCQFQFSHESTLEIVMKIGCQFQSSHESTLEIVMKIGCQFQSSYESTLEKAMKTESPMYNRLRHGTGTWKNLLPPNGITAHPTVWLLVGGMGPTVTVSKYITRFGVLFRHFQRFFSYIGSTFGFAIFTCNMTIFISGHHWLQLE